MSNIEWGILIAGVLSVIGYVVSLELRLRSVQSKLLQSEQSLADVGISDKIHAESDADLNAALSKKLSPADK